MKKTLFALVLVALLAAAVVVTAVSAQEPGHIYPWGGPYTFETTDDAFIRWGWVTTAPGLARTYVNSVFNEYTLLDADGNVVMHLSDSEADALWVGVLSVPDDYMGVVCPSGLLYGFMWTYDVGQLAAGTYTLVSTIGNTKPVNDGYHTCTNLDGTPVTSPPSLYPPGIGTSFVTIHVVEP